jgi:superfamily I DNA and/or RNA helicase
MAGSTGRDDILNSYDLVIIDEAARADLGDLLIPMSLGKTILLVGDQNQLPPYLDELAARELEKENTRYLNMLRERSFFQELFEALPETNRTMLNRQYRCHPVIGQAISNAFYGRGLLSGPENPDAYQTWEASKQPAWGIGEDSPLCWINTDGLTNAICKTVNQEETHIAKVVLERVFATGELNGQKVGLITFYRDQMHNVAAMLEECFPEHQRLVELGTVDSFQGKEFPLVVLLTSRHDPDRGRAGFLSLPNRVNVAVSRAQRQLVIIGSRKTLLHSGGGSKPFKDLVRAAGVNLKEISL